MTTAPLSVVLGVFRDHKLAEQAIEELKQTSWIVDDPQMLEKNAHGIFGAFKNARTPRETEAEELPNELAEIDMPEEQRQLYQHEFAYGSSLVLVHPQSHLLEIRDILNRHGAYHVFVPFQVGGEQTIALRKEVPQVQKQIVDIGEIRIHKRVITEERTFTVPVTREEVTIERFPRSSGSQASSQGQAASDMPLSNDTSMQTASSAPFSAEEALKEEGILRILVREEQVFIQKQIVQDVRHLVEPIKHEEVRIEHIGKAPMHETTTQEDHLPANEMS